MTSWNNDAGAGSSRQSTLVSARGGIDAPGVLSVRLVSPVRLPDYGSAHDNSLVQRYYGPGRSGGGLVARRRPAGDRVRVGEGLDLHLGAAAADGVYDVSAQAFDDVGAGGEVRSATVVVNRVAPSALTDIQASRKDNLVETAWSASRERDVIGYRVYRSGSSGPEIVCDFVADTMCVDPSPPARTASVLDYWVVAIDHDPQGGQREGAPSNHVDVNAPNTPPNSPIDLILAKDIDGNTVLQWSAPPVPDPDGDLIQSYIVYRDGTAIADRYADLASTETTFVDHSSNGSSLHDYWVTAVDDHFAESAPIGPVTG